MQRRTYDVAGIALALSVLTSTGAMATAQRTFVASYGNDANACSLPLPCRGFAAAVAQTISGGEVIVLDSAGYGPFIITQAVSIIAPPGVYAGVFVSSGTGIVVNPGGGKVVLSGLTINGTGGGACGIDFQSGTTLRVERTTVVGVGGCGIYAVQTDKRATLTIHDSAFIGNSSGLYASFMGVAALLTIEIDGSRFEESPLSHGFVLMDNVAGVVSASSFSHNYFGYGVNLNPSGPSAAINVTFRNCVFSANNIGITAGGAVTTTTIAQVTDSDISENAELGINAGTGATLVLSNTTVTRNAGGIELSSDVLSFQDNRLYGNTIFNGTFAGTIAKK
jgi:hypothetical protein